MPTPDQAPPNVRLVQLDLSPPEIPPLPQPPLLETWLFEKPIPLALALLAAGLIAWFVLRAAGKPKASFWSAFAGIALAGAGYAMSVGVVTERERVLARSTLLVDEVAAGDTAGVDVLLAERAEMTGLGWVPRADRAGILNAVDRWIGSNPVRDHSILDHRVALDGPNTARTQLRVRVQAETGITVGWFEIAWYLHPDLGWQVSRIRPLWIQGVGS